jgi:hypothetical protein
LRPLKMNIFMHLTSNNLSIQLIRRTSPSTIGMYTGQYSLCSWNDTVFQIAMYLRLVPQTRQIILSRFGSRQQFNFRNWNGFRFCDSGTCFPSVRRVRFVPIENEDWRDTKLMTIENVPIFLLLLPSYVSEEHLDMWGDSHLKRKTMSTKTVQIT